MATQLSVLVWLWLLVFGFFIHGHPIWCPSFGCYDCVTSNVGDSECNFALEGSTAMDTHCLRNLEALTIWVRTTDSGLRLHYLDASSTVFDLRRILNDFQSRIATFRFDLDDQTLLRDQCVDRVAHLTCLGRLRGGASLRAPWETTSSKDGLIITDFRKLLWKHLSRMTYDNCTLTPCTRTPAAYAWRRKLLRKGS